MYTWSTQKVTMKSSTAWSLQVLCISFLCLLTPRFVTGNDTMDSTTEVEADTGTKVGSVLPPTDSETIHTFNHEIPTQKDTSDTETYAAVPPEPQKQTHSKANSDVHNGKTDDTTVVVLVLILIVLILALVYTYKRLNRETDGEYTLTRLINGEGGARERVQSAVRVVESRLGIELRQRKRGDIEGGEGDEEEEDMEWERVNEKNAESLAEEAQDENTSDDYSSLEECDLRERKRLQGGSEKSKEGNRASVGKMEEEKGEMTREKKEEKVMKGEENCQGGGTGGGLLADLKEFSGSAIWAEEKKSEGEKNECDLTEL